VSQCSGRNQAEIRDLIEIVGLDPAAPEPGGDAVGDAEVEFDRLVQQGLAKIFVDACGPPAQKGSGRTVSALLRIRAALRFVDGTGTAG
jgi:hypothetical protein